MHLSVNAVGIKHSGGAIVLQNFIAVALTDPHITQVSVFVTPRKQRNFDLPFHDKLVEYERSAAESSYIYRILWSQFRVEKECVDIGADVLVCMSGLARTSGQVPLVTFIQQPLPFSRVAYTMVDPRQRLRLWLIKALMRRSTQAAQSVIVQTSTMKSLIVKAFRLPFERVRVILSLPDEPVCDDDVSIAQMKRIHADLRLLYVGSGSPHKNVDTIIQGMQLLREYLAGVTLFLTWPQDHPVSKIPGVECLGYLRGARLWKAYELATAVVMPSLTETVGLPMLEAMQVETPVLAADRPYAHDVCGNSALFFDPLSPEDFATKAEILLRQPELRNRLSVLGRERVNSIVAGKPYGKMVRVVLEAGNSF